jgi:hypothetical protein
MVLAFAGMRLTLPSLDDGSPEACRDAPLPAPLRSSPHFLVRSFERVALIQSASQISVGRPSIRCDFPVAIEYSKYKITPILKLRIAAAPRSVSWRRRLVIHDLPRDIVP